MTTATASPPTAIKPTHAIRINVTGPTPGFDEIPEMTEGDTVRFDCSEPVTIRFTGLSPFSSHRKNTSIPDGVILTVVRDSQDQHNKVFSAQCSLDSKKKPRTGSPGQQGNPWPANNKWGGDFPVRKPGL